MELKLRLAREKAGADTIQDHVMADTRRALRLVRSRAAEWHLMADRLGFLGISAGGELAAYAAMKHDTGQKDSTDIELPARFSVPHLSGKFRPLHRLSRDASSLHRCGN